jgi:hypothetical protein
MGSVGYHNTRFLLLTFRIGECGLTMQFQLLAGERLSGHLVPIRTMQSEIGIQAPLGSLGSCHERYSVTRFSRQTYRRAAFLA